MFYDELFLVHDENDKQEFKKFKSEVMILSKILLLIENNQTLYKFFQYKNNDEIVFMTCRDCYDYNLMVKFQHHHTIFIHGSEQVILRHLTWDTPSRSLVIIGDILSEFNKSIHWDEIKKLKTFDVIMSDVLFRDLYQKIRILFLKEGSNGPYFRKLFGLFEEYHKVSST